MLEKKLNQKAFLTQDLNKLLTATEAEHCKNKISGVYVSFNFTIKSIYLKFKFIKYTHKYATKLF